MCYFTIFILFVTFLDLIEKLKFVFFGGNKYNSENFALDNLIAVGLFLAIFYWGKKYFDSI